MKKKTIFLSLVSCPLFLFAPFVAFAQGFNICPEGASPGECVNNFYSFALLASGVLAFGAIVYGGIKYTFAAGNPSGQSEGKEWVKSALLGLLLLGAAGLILRTINPELVNLSALPGSPGLPPGGGGPSATSTCQIPSLSPLIDPQACSMEGGATVVWNSQFSDVQRNLDRLNEESNKAKNALAKAGFSMDITSAYRPIDYQHHLWEIVDRWVTLGLQNNSAPECAALKKLVGDEYQKHRLGTIVATPSVCAPHVKGIGIDIVTDYGLDKVNGFFASSSVGIRWRALANDPVHFDLQYPAFAGCSPQEGAAVEPCKTFEPQQ